MIACFFFMKKMSRLPKKKLIAVVYDCFVGGLLCKWLLPLFLHTRLDSCLVSLCLIFVIVWSLSIVAVARCSAVFCPSGFFLFIVLGIQTDLFTSRDLELPKAGVESYRRQIPLTLRTPAK